ncbi:alpha-1A adrenergic receptor [Aplochiton taeniatus]
MVPSGENLSNASVSESCPNCSSPRFPELDVTKAVTLSLVLGVFVIFGVLGNILVILSVLCHCHLRSVTHYFIANLAAADLLLSSTVLPFSATYEVLGRWVFGRALCHAWAALDVLCCTASILSLCVISVDRNLAVSYPLRYQAKATTRRGLAAVAVLWAVSAAISVGPLFGWREPDPEDETECQITEEPGYVLFSALGSFYVPLAVIVAMYCRVYVVARRETRGLEEGSKRVGREMKGVKLRIHRGNASVGCKQEDQGEDGAARQKRTPAALVRLLKFSKEKKAAKTLGIVVGCFVLCWLPFFLVLPIGSIFPSYKPSDTIFKITFWLGYLNSCINPIIYPCFSQEFKKAFLNVLHCRCLKPGARASNPPGHGPSFSPGPGPMSGLASPLSPSTQPRAAPSSGCWRSLSGPSSSAALPCQAQRARGHSKSLLKAWCFPKVERSIPQGQADQKPMPHPKILRLSLGGAGEAV